MSGKSQAVRERAVDAMLNNNGQDLNELQRQLIRWCALKFPGNNRRMSAVINKVLEQGYAGRFLMASAFTERTAGGAAFQARLRETYRARYTEFLLNLFRKAAS